MPRLSTYYTEHHKPLVVQVKHVVFIQIHPLSGIVQEAHTAEILSKDTELLEIQQRLTAEVQQKEIQIKKLSSQLQVSVWDIGSAVL